MSEPEDDPVLQNALQHAQAVQYDNYAFRAIPGGWVVHNLDFEHLWAGTSAGRCNPDGVKRLYLSVEKETAQAEFEYYATQDGVDPDLAECYSFAAKVKFERVLDLTSKAVRKQVGISLREIEADWKGKPHQPSQLQLIGYWVSKGYGKFSAILYPARRRQAGKNIVIFKECLTRGDYVTPVSRKPTKGWP
jgi:RES domain-containing protein